MLSQDEKSSNFIGPDRLPIKFSGTEPEKFPEFLDELTFFLNRNGIPIPVRNKPWLDVNQEDFVKETDELHVLTANEIATNTVLRYQGYQPGDYCLRIKNRKKWIAKVAENSLKKAHAISFLSLALVPGSYAESIVFPGKVQTDFKKMWFALIDRFQGNRLEVLLPYVIKYVKQLRSAKEHTYAIDKLDLMTKYHAAFQTVVLQDTFEENLCEIAKKEQQLVRSGELWHTLVNIVILSYISKDREMVEYFVQKHIRENKTHPLKLNLVELRQSLRNFCDIKYSP